MPSGLEIVYEGTFTDDSQTDFSVQLTGAQSAGADLLFLPIYYHARLCDSDPGQRHGLRAHLLRRGRHGRHPDPAENFDTSLAEGVMLLTPFSADAEDELTQNFVAELSGAVRRDPQPVRRRRL